jgi:hypothetical protein
MDQQFIELFDTRQAWELVDKEHMPKWPTLGKLNRLFLRLPLCAALTILYVGDPPI